MASIDILPITIAMIQSFSCSGRALRYADLSVAARAEGRDIQTYPYVIRVLLENLLRHRAWGAAVSEAEITRLWDWGKHPGADLPLHVARVILPDSSGLPVLQDLAALRDAVAQAGGLALVDRDVLRQHVHLEAARGEVVDGGLLHAEVEHGQVADALAPGRRDLGGGHRHGGGAVLPRHLGRLAHQPQLLLGVDARGVTG